MTPFKRILYACSQFPWPLDNGQKIVSFNDLKYLSQRFEVSVLAFMDPLYTASKGSLMETLKQKLPGVNFLEPVSQRILREGRLKKSLRYFQAMAFKRPYVVQKYVSTEYQQCILQSLASGEFDWLYIDHIQPSFVLGAVKGVKIIYRAHDVMAETLENYALELGWNPLSLLVRLDRAVCARYEHSVWKRADVILTVTSRLAQLISQAEPGVAQRVCYLPVVIEAMERLPEGNCANQSVLYAGTVHYPPNFSGLKWFMQKCWPLIQQKFPGAQFDVVGRGGETLKPAGPSVVIHGYQADLAPFYAQSAVLIVPLFSGSGIRLKILDAFRWGIPVVATTAGYSGLEVRVGQDLLVGDTAEDFTHAICELIGNSSLRQTLRENGWAYLNTFHSPAAMQAGLDEMENLIVE
jgi:glycosyltransferase involved in cell wall biosynthesis